MSPRAEILQRVWGLGMHLPGGMRVYSELRSFLDLAAGQRLLHLGAGFGGLGDRWRIDGQVDVDGFESDRDCVDASAALFPPPEGKPVVWLKAEGPPPDLEMEFYDAAICHEALLPVVDKTRWMTRLRDSLKPGGRLALVEILAGEDEWAAADLPAMTAWRRGERLAPDLWKLTRFMRALEQSGFEIAAAVDITRDYRDRAVGGFGEFLKGIGPEDLEAPLRDALMSEAELWARRSAAVDANGLRVAQITAMRA